MKKMIVLAGLYCLALTVSQIHAQSINNRNWVAFFGNPINDTLTFHIKSDSSFVTNSLGDVIIHTSCKFNNDTLTIHDRGDGEHECPGTTGVYKISVSGNTMSLAIISDDCEGRGQALSGVKWTEAMKKP